MAGFYLAVTGDKKVCQKQRSICCVFFESERNQYRIQFISRFVFVLLAKTRNTKWKFFTNKEEYQMKNRKIKRRLRKLEKSELKINKTIT